MGRSSKDIFLGKLNGIAPYNGTDVQYLYQFNNTSIRIFMGRVFDKEIFFLAYDTNNSLNLIIRGKLNEWNGGNANKTILNKTRDDASTSSL